MANYVDNVMSIIENGVLTAETNFKGANGYTNAIGIRTKGSEGTHTAQIIIADTKTAFTGNTYDSAPIGSIGINKTGGAGETLYIKISATAWEAPMVNA